KNVPRSARRAAAPPGMPVLRGETEGGALGNPPGRRRPGCRGGGLRQGPRQKRGDKGMKKGTAERRRLTRVNELTPIFVSEGNRAVPALVPVAFRDGEIGRVVLLDESLRRKWLRTKGESRKHENNDSAKRSPFPAGFLRAFA